MIVCKELKESFDTKELLFKSLKDRKEEIIKAKKSQVKKQSCTTVKALEGFNGVAPFPTKKGYFYAVINSTNVMDSHNDVHLESIWNKSAVEKNGKISYVAQHDFGIDGLIATKNDVNIQLHKTTFKDAGFDLDGDTTLLVYEIAEKEIVHDKVKKLVEARKDFEQSVSMEYVNVTLCINSEDKEFKEEKKDFDKYIDQVANKDKAIEQGYYFAVSEAKISREGSAVLEGSNSATKVFYHIEENKSIEPLQDTQNVEPSRDTQDKIDYEYISKNLKLN